MLDQSAKGAFVLGPTSPRSGGVSVGERWLCEGPGTDTTTPRRFPTTPPGANHGAAWCDRATGLHVTVIGPQRFVDRAIASFRIAPFSTAPRATKIVVAERTVRAGGLIRGVVVVVNNTGAALTYSGCHGLFGIALAKPGEAPSAAWPACGGSITVPEGESEFSRGRDRVRDQLWFDRRVSPRPRRVRGQVRTERQRLPGRGADSGTSDRGGAGLIRRHVRARPALRVARGSARVSGGGS